MEKSNGAGLARQWKEMANKTVQLDDDGNPSVHTKFRGLILGPSEKR
jgi:hypothetical protein